MKKRIAIIGSRDFPTSQLVEAYVASLPDDSIVVSGGARGVDSWAVQAAENRGLEVKVFDADWRTHGAKAGPIRNASIIASSDHVTAFWDRKSRGTLNSLVLASEGGLPIIIFDSEGIVVSTVEALEAARRIGVVASIEKSRRQASSSGRINVET